MYKCIKDLTIVHRYGNVYRYTEGQVISENTLLSQGVNPTSEYFERK